MSAVGPRLLLVIATSRWSPLRVAMAGAGLALGSMTLTSPLGLATRPLPLMSACWVRSRQSEPALDHNLVRRLTRPPPFVDVTADLAGWKGRAAARLG